MKIQIYFYQTSRHTLTSTLELPTLPIVLAQLIVLPAFRAGVAFSSSQTSHNARVTYERH